jgi:hypothetical protein
MKANKPVVSLGPYFIDRAPEPPDPELEAAGVLRLNLNMEFAVPSAAQSIELFERIRPCSGPGTLEELVIRKDQVPIRFIALECLLAELYRRSYLSRPVLPVLRELDEKTQITSRLGPNRREGLLLPCLEAEGFEVQDTFWFPEDATGPMVLYASIAWRSSPWAEAIQVLVPSFRPTDCGSLADCGRWNGADWLCVAKLLWKELRRLAHGRRPLELLTAAGKEVVLCAEPGYCPKPA